MPPAAPPKPITLFLMTGKGYSVLRHIVEQLDPALIDQVIGARDKNLRQDYYDEIQALCRAAGIPFVDRAQPYTVRSAYSIAISWRWLIRNAGKLIVLHDSLLPRYRGFAPLVNCLINHEAEIGVTAVFSEAEFDRGPIIQAEARPVTYPVKIAQAIELTVECYTALTTDILRGIAAGTLPAGVPQDESQASYSLWRDEEDYRIDWQADSARLKRFIDAVGWPYQGASTLLNGQLARVYDAEVEPDVRIENRTAGKVMFIVEGQPVVVCGTGLLRLTRVSFETGKDALPLKPFRTRFS
jgi:methionyl-tRNA formyltransferase